MMGKRKGRRGGRRRDREGGEGERHARRGGADVVVLWGD